MKIMRLALVLIALLTAFNHKAQDIIYWDDVGDLGPSGTVTSHTDPNEAWSDSNPGCLTVDYNFAMSGGILDRGSPKYQNIGAADNYWGVYVGIDLNSTNSGGMTLDVDFPGVVQPRFSVWDISAAVCNTGEDYIDVVEIYGVNSSGVFVYPDITIVCSSLVISGANSNIVTGTKDCAFNNKSIDVAFNQDIVKLVVKYYSGEGNPPIQTGCSPAMLPSGDDPDFQKIFISPLIVPDCPGPCTPPVLTQPSNVELCKGEVYTLPSITGSDLVSPKYYTEINRGGSELAVGSEISSDQDVFIFDINDTCDAEVMFEVRFKDTLQPNFVNPPSFFCNDASTVALVTDISGGVFSSDCGSCLDAIGNFDPSNATIGDNTIIYTVTQNGCDGSTNITFEVQDYIDPSFTVNSYCWNDNQTVNITNPGGEFTLISNPLGATVNAATGILNDNIPGNYRLEYETDNSGCKQQSYVDFEIFDIAPFVIDDTVVCVDPTGSISYDAGAGYDSYSWNQGNNANSQINSISIATANNFELIATVEKGICSFSDTADITIIDIPDPAFSSTDWCINDGNQPLPNPVLVGGTFVLTQTPYASVNINASTGELSPTVRGIYEIKYVVGGNTCKDSSTQTVRFDSIVEVVLLDSVICQGESVGLQVNNIYDSYQWNGDVSQTSTSVTVNSTGKFYVDVTNGLCSSSDTSDITVEQYPDPSFATTNWCINDGNQPLPNSVSTGGTYVLTQSSNALVNINSSTGVLSPEMKGDYELKYVVGSLCKDSSIQTVRFDSIIEVKLIDSTVCQGQSVELEVDNNYDSYQWNGGVSQTSTSITVNTTGKYYVDVTNGLCSSSDTSDINVIQLLDPSFTIDPWCINDGGINLPNPTEMGGEYKLIQAPNNLLSINSGTGEISSFVKGQYEIRYVIANGACADSSSETFFLDSIVEVVLEDTSICAGQSVLLQVDNIYDTYEWNDNSSSNTNTLLVSTDGESYIEVSSGLCVSSDTANISITNYPNANIEGPDFCLTTDSSQFFQADLVGGTYSSSTLNIDDATGEILNPLAGTHIVRYDIAGQCPSFGVDTIVIDTISLQLPIIEICEYETAFLSPILSYYDSYLWSNGSTSNSIVLDKDTDTTSFSLTVQNGFCEISTTVIDLTIKPKPDVTIDSLFTNEGYQLWSSGANDYIWSPETNISCTNCDDPVVSSLQEELYTVIGNLDGCMDTATILIQYELDFIVPNVITPNGDGVNDFFYIDQPLLETCKMKIFNRWGNFIYETEDCYTGWSGVNEKELMCIDGTYYYFIEANVPNKETKTFTGTVYLKK